MLSTASFIPGVTRFVPTVKVNGVRWSSTSRVLSKIFPPVLAKIQGKQPSGFVRKDINSNRQIYFWGQGELAKRLRGATLHLGHALVCSLVTLMGEHSICASITSFRKRPATTFEKIRY
eukprot:1194528-Prorocentrum_minimum.AAC.6